jgi:hypothetical protein
MMFTKCGVVELCDHSNKNMFQREMLFVYNPI